MSQENDGRTNEKILSDISRLIESKKPKTNAEIEAIIDGIMKNGGKIPKQKSTAATAREKAEDIINNAFEASRAKQIKLAKEALEIYPGCVDAYLLIAEDETDIPGKAYPLLCKAVEAGRQDLGEKIFNEMKGHFWGYVETRPFMRAMSALSDCLVFMEKYDEAIAVAKEMLELNPGDNQGMRYKLLTMYGLAKKYTEMENLLNHKEYESDMFTGWAYGRVLISYIKNGDCKLTETAIKEAMKVNKYVPEYFAFYEDIPKPLPSSYSLGSREEAMIYVTFNMGVWIQASQALKSLVSYAAKNLSEYTDKPKFRGKLM